MAQATIVVHGDLADFVAAPEDDTEPSFVLDGHVGRLAAYLRMLGVDAHDDFRRCPDGDAVYWKGSRRERMTRPIERVGSLNLPGSPTDSGTRPSTAG